MDKKESKMNEQTKEFFDNIKFINDKDLGDLNFFEACLYLEKLNVLDNATIGLGDSDD